MRSSSGLLARETSPDKNPGASGLLALPNLKRFYLYAREIRGKCVLYVLMQSSI